ncbi:MULTISPECIES: hypothetical protein [unclassified Thalassospira]|nr:hypothetical protein [Thalassospira sp.]MBO6772934.1 hypothetical protein [Thalassospira sp.]
MMSYVDQELSIEDMLADPIVQTLMRYDGISASDVRHTIEQVNQNRAQKAEAALPGTHHHNRLHWGAPHANTSRLRHNAA